LATPVRPDAGQQNNPLPLAQGAGSGNKIFRSFFREFLEEKAGQARDDRFRWPDRFQGK
jgi:hypothetical protein